MARILVVEDDPISAEMCCGIIKKLGHKPTAAQSAREAVECIRRELPDAIILDVILPDIEGFQLGRNLKGHPRTRDIPIAYVTGRSNSEDFRKGFECGGMIYLTKPYTADALQTALSSLLLTPRRKGAEQI